MRHLNLPQNGVLGQAVTSLDVGGPTRWEPKLLVQPPVSRCSTAQGYQPPPDEVSVKKATRRGCSGWHYCLLTCKPNCKKQPRACGGVMALGTGGAAIPASLQLPTVAPLAPLLLRAVAGGCGGQTWCLQRTTTLTLGRGAAGKRLPLLLPGRPQAGASLGFTGTGLTAPSRGLPGSARASPGRSEPIWGPVS